MAWKTSQGTKHSVDCKMVFGRKDHSCPRCQELLAGSEPRKWFGIDNDQRRCAEIREHFSSHKHLSGGCGVVCTFGDY
jgi:hypothetical protein